MFQLYSQLYHHCVSKKIAHLPGIRTYSLEDLTGIRNQRRHKKMNKWISSWPFYQLEQFLAYKAEAIGKEIGFVDARYTSQKCSRCGHIHSANRKKSRFSCGSCGYYEHFDINAAYNIRDNYILSSTQVDRGAGHSQLPNRSGHAHLVSVDDQLQAIRPRAGGS